VKQRLALSATAIDIARFTVFFQLGYMPPNRSPARDLP
jgi:hypothetical protein